MYDRMIDGKTLTIRPSGWTYNDTFVLMDVETGSLWYPDWKGLKGIQGAHFKKRLGKVKFEDTSWKEWELKHPGSKVLK